jgi:formate dehydrogenase maturation protein FdhE
MIEADKVRLGDCPKCGSLDIVGDSFEMGTCSVSQDVHCVVCEHEWNDNYIHQDMIPFLLKELFQPGGTND